MIPAGDDAVQVDFDNAQARLKVRNMDVFDDHDIANSLTQGQKSYENNPFRKARALAISGAKIDAPADRK